MSGQSEQFKKQITVLFQNKIGEAHYVDEEPHMLHYLIAGGFYPLVLGQQLNIFKAGGKVGKNATFEIVRKLGLGLCSSVWLVHSTGYGNLWYALRLLGH